MGRPKSGITEPNVLEDAWDYVERDADDKCWPWIGTVHKKGYGMFWRENTEIKAHRAIYELKFGSIPNGMQVMHRCNVKVCCNPAHLQLGTDVENQAHASISCKRKTNTSGCSGVSQKTNTTWVARATVRRKRTILYQGSDFFEACCARKSWEAKRLKEILL